MAHIDFSNVGFDYGIKPFWVVLGDMEFSDLFTKADCRGVLYIFREGEKGEMVPVQMAFLFQNEVPAEKFMDHLMGWTSRSNDEGDAVTIDFIENDKGGYTLAISPEAERLSKRTIPQHLRDRVSPIFMIQTHFKEIDTLGQNYINFKTNYSRAGKIAIGYVIGNERKIQKQSEKYFSKSEFNFYKQNTIPTNSVAIAYNATLSNSKFNPQFLPKPPKISAEEISQRRISEMKSLLPLTTSKLKNLWLGDIQRQLSSLHNPDAIDQAICNLTIFERMRKNTTVSPDFTKEGYPIRILEYLLDTYESFNSYYPPDDFYTVDRIIGQIKNDQKELESYLNK